MLGPTAEAGEIAIQLLRQLGEPELADRLSRLFPLELEYDETGGELDEALRDGLMDEADEVAADFAHWLAENAHGLDDDEIWQARQDVELALDFRANYLGAGARGVWTDEELDAFLLSFVPRKVMTSEDDRARMPASLERMFRFLGERGDVIPPAAEKLARRAIALSAASDPFVQASPRLRDRVPPQQAPRDDEALDLVRALADQEQGVVAVQALDLELLRVAVAAVDAH